MSIVGTWSSHQPLRVLHPNGGGVPRIVSSPFAVSTVLVVGKDGTVNGRIGGAILSSTCIDVERGWWGRMTGDQPTSKIVGRLDRKIFFDDMLAEKDIVLTVRRCGNILNGHLEQILGSEMFLMGVLMMWPLDH